MKNYKNIAVVIPSYNEVKNLSILIKGINKKLPSSKIVIVDDSRLEENTKLKEIVKKYKNIKLISRLKKSGRGSAVLDGFKEALKNKKINYIFEMDSDLAHDPREFKRFIKKNENGNYDLIIGSRYLPGGKIINISSDRTILSRAINKFLYFWLGMHLSDHTSGFRLYKRKSVEYLLKSKIKSTGFITLSETAYKLFLSGFSIAEVPITWNYRIYGKSNVDFKELLDSLYFVLGMRVENTFLSKFEWKKIVAVVGIFIFALLIRVESLNQMGRTWDEFLYIEQGYKMDELIKKGDFANSYFYTTYDHPPLAKYIYGITAHLDKNGVDKYSNPTFNYEYTYSRVLSSVFASLSAVLVLLIAWEYVSPYVGLLSGIIFSTLPFFIGLSQLVSTESILMFLFTSSIYSFIKLLERYSWKKIIITGVLTGLALLSKQSNALIFPILFFYYLIWFYKVNPKSKFFGKVFLSIIYIGLISIIVFVALWPMPYFHLDVISEINQKIWLVKTSPPVIFWGELILAPKIYFITFYFITTPLLIILLSLIGLKKIEQRKNWVLYGLIIWFLFPFVQSFYAWRAHGIRYIIEIYAPLAIISALGVAFLIEKFRLGIRAKFISIALVTIYMFFSFLSVRPYYLDYFNILVGGAKGVYDNKYFELGWWGQGLREAGYYLDKNAKKNSKVCIYVSPLHSFPALKNVRVIKIYPKNPYDPNIECDYVVVNYFHVLREGFDDSGIKSDYNLIYQVKAGQAPIVDIYSKNN